MSTFTAQTVRSGKRVLLSKRFAAFLGVAMLFHGGALSAQSDKNWTGAGTAVWKVGDGNGGENWTDDDSEIVDFDEGDTALFDSSASSKNVELDGEISTGATNINGGEYTFTGSGYLSAGKISIADGASLSLQNTVANTFTEGTSIAKNGTLSIQRSDALGSGTVENKGTLNISLESSSTFANILSGDGAVNIRDGGTVTLTANSTATGKLETQNDLNFGNGGSTGSYAGDISSTKTIIVNRTGTWSYGGNLTGTGTFTMSNASGRFVLSGTDSMAYTVASNGTLEVAEGGAIDDSSTSVLSGATLELTAAKTQSAAALQGGSLTIESGGTLQTNFIDYGMKIGEEKDVYLAYDLDEYQNDGNTLEIANRLYRISDAGLQYAESEGTLYYSLTRISSADAFPNLSPSIAATLDDYQGGNSFLDGVLDLSTPESSIQSGFDFFNLSGAASAVYEAKTAVNNSLNARALDEHVYFVNGYRGQCGGSYGASYGLPSGRRPFLGRTELWGSFLYDNTRGFGLNSGNFRYGYMNDLYGLTFGMDRTNGAERFGLMGAVGWSNIRSYGDIADTRNDTGFGGVYAYLNERFGGVNLFAHAGWLGMTSDIRQTNNGDELAGRVNNGMASLAATLSQMFCLDGLHITASVGVEYGLYYQNSMDVSWGDEQTFRNDSSNANLVMVPVAVRFSREIPVYHGILRPEIRLRYIANVADVVANYDTWITASNTPAPLSASIADRHVGDLGLGIGWTEGFTTISGNYGFIFSENRQSQFVSLNGLWKF